MSERWEEELESWYRLFEYMDAVEYQHDMFEPIVLPEEDDDG